MDITFACESCGQSIVIDGAAAGQLVDCLKCGKPLEVPYKFKPLDKAATPSPPLAEKRLVLLERFVYKAKRGGRRRRMILLFRCRKCRTHLRAEDNELGAQTSCPNCQKSMIIPRTTARTECPLCHLGILFSADVEGETFHCPDCDAPLPLSAGSDQQPQAAALSREPTVTGSQVAPSTPQKSPAKRGLFQFTKRSWCIVDCLTGEGHQTDKLPLEIGSAAAVDLRLDDVSSNHCALTETKHGGVCLVPRDPEAEVLLNGVPIETSTRLDIDKDYTLNIRRHFFLLRGGRSAEKWLKGLDLQQWFIHQPQKNTTEGPMELRALGKLVTSRDYDPRATVVYPSGAGLGFYLWQISDLLTHLDEESGASPNTTGPALTQPVSSDTGNIRCPVCWLRFDKGDVMNIATDETLRGDPVLGEGAMLRFTGTRFNNVGHAIDAMGIPCPDIACPYCRRKLPLGYMDLEHHILSVIGPKRAGKSYYLSVLAKVLPEVLSGRFGITFKDADPEGNALLNDMRDQIFNATTPQEAFLKGTQIAAGQTQDATYELVPRFGRQVLLPKPFIYSLTPASRDKEKFGAIFYDNAGEHFQPGKDSELNPGTQHLASASVILFLYDPTVNRNMRRRLPQTDDPQWSEDNVGDQQDILLAEMEVRIKRTLGIDQRSRIATPIALIVGKCDGWLSLLGQEPLSHPLSGGQLAMDVIAANSVKVRQLLQETAPSIVANAESISQEVMYFPVSSFGHTPSRQPSGAIAPDPRRLQPFQVEVPVLWALSKVRPGLIPQRANLIAT